MSKFDKQAAWNRAVQGLDHLCIQEDVFAAIEHIRTLEARIAKLTAATSVAKALLPLLDDEEHTSVNTWEKVVELNIALSVCDDGEKP